MGKIEFIQEFRATAHQLNTYAAAGDWARLAEQLAVDGTMLTAQQAARWANLGYLPGEAEREMAAGVTLEQAEHAANPQQAHIWRDGRRLA